MIESCFFGFAEPTHQLEGIHLARSSRPSSYTLGYQMSRLLTGGVMSFCLVVADAAMAAEPQGSIRIVIRDTAAEFANVQGQTLLRKAEVVRVLREQAGVVTVLRVDNAPDWETNTDAENVKLKPLRIPGLHRWMNRR